MGRVFAGRDPELKRDVAIKILNVAGLKSPAMLARFHIEAQASAMLEHANIVPVYDHGTSDGIAYLVMKRIRGLSIDRIVNKLFEQTRKGATEGMRMDWHVVANIGAQVAAALAYAHSRSVIHRDIKPANLILEGLDKVWVTDFGLAKLLEENHELSVAGDIIGTPKYMAPEQIRGVSDPRSDIYGLGLTLYELASGRPVWEAITAQEIVEKRSSLELPELKTLNPAIPNAVSDIIMKACAFRPEDRYQSAEELNYVLTRFAHGNPVGDRRRTRNGNRSIWQRRSWQISMISGFAGSLALVGVAFWMMSQPQKLLKDPATAVKVLEDDNLRTRFVQELPKLIDEMVQNDDPKFRSALGTLAEKSIDRTVQHYDLKPEDKEKLQEKVHTWVESYKAGEISLDQAGSMMHGFAGSPIGMVLRFRKLEEMIQFSTLPTETRNQAFLTLKRLQFGIVNQIVRNAQTGHLLDELEILSQQGTINPERGYGLAVPDDQLLRYLHEVYLVVEAAGISSDPGQLEAAAKVETAVESSLTDPALNEMLQKHYQGLRGP